MRNVLFVCLLFVLGGCSRTCVNYPVMGADEFVKDSYQIRQGKMAVLAMEGNCVQCLPKETMQEYRDVVEEDDILNIVIYHPTRSDLTQLMQQINHSTGGFRVRQGWVNLPDIEPVHVAGLTLEEARQRLQDTFQEQIRDVEVFVTYRERLRNKVELTGMVARPSIPVDGKIRLYEVISQAQLRPEANLFMSYVVRQGTPLPVDMYRLVHRGDMSQNIVMRGGDKVFIANPQDAQVMLMGEVGYPRAVPLPYGFISLREALVTAGGIPFTGNKQRIQVIRGNLRCPKIYVLSWNHIIHLPNDSLLLMPGDTVYVTPTPITEWNRFVNQLLPSFSGFRAGYDMYSVIP